MLLIAAALTTIPAGLAAQPTGPAATSRPRPRLALALSGGGARGIAHIGALRALEEAALPLDAIAANSMGAIVGAIYSTGRTADELETIVRSLDWAALFSGRPDRRVLPVARRHDRHASLAGISFDFQDVRLPSGLLADHRVNRFLIENLAPAAYEAGFDFDALPIPFRAVATDLGSGEPVVLARGDLALAVRASMSIPLVFPPVDWQGRKLVDGLVVNNLPCDVAKGFDPLVLVSVDIGSPPLEPAEYESALGVASQINNLLTDRRNRDFQVEADVAVRPDLGKHSPTDYSDFDELIRKAYEATKASVPAIREKLAAAGVIDMSRRPRSSSGPRLEGARIVEVTVEGNQRTTDRLVRRFFNVPVGPRFSMVRGLRAFDKADASGLLDSTWMELLPQGEGVRVQLRVTDAPPNRAEVGIGYSEWQRARGHIRLLNQNTLGFGEQVDLLAAASDAETLLQGALKGERLFLTGLGYRVTAYDSTDKPRYFDTEGDEINRARFQRQGVEVALRSSFERWGLLETGLRFGRVKTQERAGIDVPAATDQVGTWFGSFTVDTLDSLEWADAGERLAIWADWNAPDLGAEYDSWRFAVEGSLARKPSRRTSLQLDGQVGFSGGDLPPYDWYRVGGATLVPGYHHDELKGPDYFAGAAAIRYRFFAELRLYARVGAGNVSTATTGLGFDKLRWGVSAGAYYPTPIGPVAAEFGVHDGGSTLASLSVGWN